MSNNVETGSTVTLHYSGVLNDGTQFGSSYDRGDPMTVTVGSGQLISGFDEALMGMTAGEKKTFMLEPGQAYGDRNPQAITELDRSIFPDDLTLDVGTTLPLMDQDGQPFIATVAEVKDDSVVADLNHPLAGEDLTFTVEVITVQDDEDTTGQNIIFLCEGLSRQRDALRTMVPKQGHPSAVESED